MPVLDPSGPLFEMPAHGYRQAGGPMGRLRGYLCEFELRDGVLRFVAARSLARVDQATS